MLLIWLLETFLRTFWHRSRLASALRWWLVGAMLATAGLALATTAWWLVATTALWAITDWWFAAVEHLRLAKTRAARIYLSGLIRRDVQ